jgi:starch synthase
VKVYFVASEGVPFAKTGGLADVVGTLPKALAAQGADVAVILPKYREITERYGGQIKHIMYLYVNLGWRRQYCGIETLCLDGIDYYFLDNEFYFGRDGLYGNGDDEGERFGFFCRAVLEMLPHIGMPDILHCNDWQTGMIPALLEMQYRRQFYQYSALKTVFTIHNLQYQGIFPWGWIAEMLGIEDRYFTPDALEYYGCINYMKGGIAFSDYVTTVSPSYAQEIKGPWQGKQLDGLIRSRGDAVVGILNGIDLQEFDPKTDPHIAQTYSAEELDKKTENKYALQRELGLVEGDAPLIAMVTRFVPQKGIDLVEYAMDDIMKTGAQFVVLGMGDAQYVDFFRWAQWRYEGNFAARIEMNNPLAHRIYAGADMLLMPSQFEPCGLSQMIAMRYGTLPIVRETGGLKDTVEPYNQYTGEGNGFSFSTFNAHDMLHIIRLAQTCYADQALWRRLQIQAMNSCFSWERSAAEYIALYHAVLAN